MGYLTPTLSQFENHHKMMLILTFGLILLVLAGAGRLYADDYTKAQMQYITGLKPQEDQSQITAKKIQTSIEGLLNTAQISHTKWQVAKLFGTRIQQGLKSNLQFPNQLCDAVTGHFLNQSCCLAEREVADNSLLKGDEYDIF